MDAYRSSYGKMDLIAQHDASKTPGPEIPSPNTSTSSTDESGISKATRKQKLFARMSIKRDKRKERDFHRRQKYNKLSMSDFYSKQGEFKMWMAELKLKSLENCPLNKQKGYFKKFVREWNKRKLPTKYYRMDEGTPPSDTKARFSFFEDVVATPEFLNFPEPIDLSLQNTPGRVYSPNSSGLSTFGKSSGLKREGAPPSRDATPKRPALSTLVGSNQSQESTPGVRLLRKLTLQTKYTNSPSTPQLDRDDMSRDTSMCVSDSSSKFTDACSSTPKSALVLDVFDTPPYRENVATSKHDGSSSLYSEIVAACHKHDDILTSSSNTIAACPAYDDSNNPCSPIVNVEELITPEEQITPAVFESSPGPESIVLQRSGTESDLDAGTCMQVTSNNSDLVLDVFESPPYREKTSMERSHTESFATPNGSFLEEKSSCSSSLINGVETGTDSGSSIVSSITSLDTASSSFSYTEPIDGVYQPTVLPGYTVYNNTDVCIVEGTTDAAQLKTEVNSLNDCNMVSSAEYTDVGELESEAPVEQSSCGNSLVISSIKDNNETSSPDRLETNVPPVEDSACENSPLVPNEEVAVNVTCILPPLKTDVELMTNCYVAENQEAMTTAYESDTIEYTGEHHVGSLISTEIQSNEQISTESLPVSVCDENSKDDDDVVVETDRQTKKSELCAREDGCCVGNDAMVTETNLDSSSIVSQAEATIPLEDIAIDYYIADNNNNDIGDLNAEIGVSDASDDNERRAEVECDVNRGTISCEETKPDLCDTSSVSLLDGPLLQLTMPDVVLQSPSAKSPMALDQPRPLSGAYEWVVSPGPEMFI